MSIDYQGIIWAGISVDNMKASIEFYQNALGLRLLASREDFALFDAGSGARVELVSGGKASGTPKNAARQSTAIALQVKDIERVRSELEQKGVTFSGDTGSYRNMRWATLIDPEGNRIEIKEIVHDQGKPQDSLAERDDAPQ